MYIEYVQTFYRNFFDKDVISCEYHASHLFDSLNSKFSTYSPLDLTLFLY